jgi:PAS domain S-box-containing protein
MCRSEQHSTHLQGPIANMPCRTWWCANLFPLAKDDGSFGGCASIWQDQTRQILSDRRTKLLNDLGHFDLKNASFWNHVLTVLRSNSRDIAMAILYSAERYTEGDDNYTLYRKGIIGFGTSDAAAPQEIDLKTCQSGFAPAMRKARQQRSDWLPLGKHEFPEHVLDEVDWQGYGEQSRTIVVVPLGVVNSVVSGFVIIGLNPRRDFDDDHQQFVTDLRRQLVTILTSVLTVEQAKSRENQLTHDLAESERRIRTMAEYAPMGMYDLSPKGELIWANQHFFPLVGCAKPPENSDFSWHSVVHEDDKEQCGADIKKCLVDQAEISNTVRLKRKWKPPSDGETHEEEHAWVFYSAFPHIEDGTVSSIMGCMTDVSQFKWAEELQTKKIEEACKARQRQNEFIDVVSHELRSKSIIFMLSILFRRSLQLIGDNRVCVVEKEDSS